MCKLELKDLDLILIKRVFFAGFGMWSILVVQSEQQVIYRLIDGRQGGGGGGREAQSNMEETDGERLP